MRGALLLLSRLDLVEPQLYALNYAGATGRKLSIMFPMITLFQVIVALSAAREHIRAEIAAPNNPL